MLSEHSWVIKQKGGSQVCYHHQSVTLTFYCPVSFDWQIKIILVLLFFSVFEGIKTSTFFLLSSGHFLLLKKYSTSYIFEAFSALSAQDFLNTLVSRDGSSSTQWGLTLILMQDEQQSSRGSESSVTTLASVCMCLKRLLGLKLGVYLGIDV